KAVGAQVAPDLIALVKLRNEAARKLGFLDFHVLQLVLAEQDQTSVTRLFDELDDLTREPFRQVKAEIDAALAARYGITAAELRPWHYEDPFFQEAPATSGVDLDQPWKGQDLLKLCRDFYASIGLPIDDVIAKSDLYERKG